jgi:hypothetical protein
MRINSLHKPALPAQAPDPAPPPDAVAPVPVRNVALIIIATGVALFVLQQMQWRLRLEADTELGRPDAVMPGRNAAKARTPSMRPATTSMPRTGRISPASMKHQAYSPE